MLSETRQRLMRTMMFKTEPFDGWMWSPKWKRKSDAERGR